MFENLLMLGWLEILIIVLASIGVCTGIILMIDIWMNREWTPIIKAKKYKTIEIGKNSEGISQYEQVEYTAIVDWGTVRSIVSGILLGIFYSIAALIGLGEVVMVTDIFGDITNIWTIRVVPIILCVFVGFFSDTFWKLIYWIGELIEKKIEQRKALASIGEEKTQLEIDKKKLEMELEKKAFEEKKKVEYGKVEQIHPLPSATEPIPTPQEQVVTATPPANTPPSTQISTTQVVQEILEDKPIDNQL